MHNRESAEASSPELARAPLPALLVSGAFPPAPRLPPPSPALISTPSWPGARGTLRGGPGPRGPGWGREGGREGAAQHPSRRPGSSALPRWRCGGARRGALLRAETAGAGSAGGGGGGTDGTSRSTSSLSLGRPSAPGASSCRRVRPSPEVWWRSWAGEGGKAGRVQRSAPPPRAPLRGSAPGSLPGRG